MKSSYQEITGDFHNFKNAVRRIKVDGVFLFEKPRTMYWENLFFGVSSPLREVFQNTIMDSLFQLSSVFIDGREYQKEVSYSSVKTFDYKQFGFLISYCYCLGIQDLHHMNVIFSENGLQPIDIEVVFSDLTHPSQTLLIPGPNISLKRSSLGLLHNNISDVSLENTKEIISGFYDGTMVILNNLEKIKEIFKFQDVINDKNIRVIFRDTKEYQHLQPDYFREEIEQIKRGDIPYFFKKIGQDSVYYYVDPGVSSIVKILSEKNIKIANHIGLNSTEILSKEILISKRIPRGILSLLATFRRNFNHSSYIELGEHSLEVEEEVLVFNFGQKYRLNLC